MKANPEFLNLTNRFWAAVRLLSEEVGYTKRKTNEITRPSEAEIQFVLEGRGLKPDFLDRDLNGKRFCDVLVAYFAYRATILENNVRLSLMDKTRAEQVFIELCHTLSPKCPLPINKQSGEKKVSAYLTGIVNMLIESNAAGHPCDFDPRKLITFSKEGEPIRTLSRRVDGAFPSTHNPVAIWEIKEYYHSTTFGSRIADGVYETLLDGLELEDLRTKEEMHVRHYLMVDAYHTWWVQGRSYLCRIIDMLHMGHLEEVLFGYEVVERLPSLVGEWLLESQGAR